MNIEAMNEKLVYKNNKFLILVLAGLLGTLAFYIAAYVDMAVTGVTLDITVILGLKRYSMYVMDYGAPVGFRLFVRHPNRVESFIVQNGNAYEEGLLEFWNNIKAWWKDKTDENEKKLHYLVAADTTKWQYTNGTRNPDSIDPENWITDQAGMDRPGNVAIQLAMMYDYKTNPPLYPKFQEFFRKYQPPMLIVWGKNDYIFPEEGAHPYERDLKDVEKYILDTGHFALEEDRDFIAEKIRNFLNSRTKN